MKDIILGIILGIILFQNVASITSLTVTAYKDSACTTAASSVVGGDEIYLRAVSSGLSDNKNVSWSAQFIDAYGTPVDTPQTGETSLASNVTKFAVIVPKTFNGTYFVNVNITDSTYAIVAQGTSGSFSITPFPTGQGGPVEWDTTKAVGMKETYFEGERLKVRLEYHEEGMSNSKRFQVFDLYLTDGTNTIRFQRFLLVAEGDTLTIEKDWSLIGLKGYYRLLLYQDNEEKFNTPIEVIPQSANEIATQYARGLPIFVIGGIEVPSIVLILFIFMALLLAVVFR